jgi:hypothetical protein
MTASHKTHPVDFILAAMGSGYDSRARALAIEAHDAGRACVLTTGKYHNQFAANAADAVNGGADLVEVIKTKAAEQRRDLEWTRKTILQNLIPANVRGAALIEAARFQ